MSVIFNSPVHFYKPVECSKFVYGAPVVRSIILENERRRLNRRNVSILVSVPKKGKEMIEDQQGANFTMWPYLSIPGSSQSF